RRLAGVPGRRRAARSGLPRGRMRRPLIAGNWKMYKTVPEGVALAQDIRAGLALPLKDRDVLVAPPFTALAAVAEALRGSDVLLGAQNMHWEREGAFTGEISPAMLKQVGCSHVILGHSERRHIFAESDDMVAASSPTTSTASWRSPTWTARSSGARA